FISILPLSSVVQAFLGYFRTARRRFVETSRNFGELLPESGQLWREEVTALHAAEFPDVALRHMYVDNCAMQLVRAPNQFDVIVTDNMFGDILSDCAAMAVGSLGMLPSASLGLLENGRRRALYQQVHGSAPDTAGQGTAN